jgi:formamidopyrimidine-DNA glycosylase
MPELPDITVYLEALQQRILGEKLVRVRLASPFLLRTAFPPLEAVEGKTVQSLRRIGKRLAIGVTDDYWLVLHLMIAGRLHWRDRPEAATDKIKTGRDGPGKFLNLPQSRRGAPLPRKSVASFDFSSGSLLLTEAGSKKRASLHVVQGEAALQALDPGGLEVLEADLGAFTARLTAANHTLKRALTDPRLFSGIGNAYSDEILHRAMLSPVALTKRLGPEEIQHLYTAIRQALQEWTDKLRAEAKGHFPEKVTAFREGMAVHGRHGKPCPRCGSKVQRIRYADNETDYCARCQTGGRLLADRALSRLLKEDWPRTLEEWEAIKGKDCRAPRPQDSASR